MVNLPLFLVVIGGAMVGVKADHEKTSSRVSHSMGQSIMSDQNNVEETYPLRKNVRFMEKRQSGRGPIFNGDIIWKTLRKRMIDQTTDKFETPFCGIGDSLATFCKDTQGYVPYTCTKFHENPFIQSRMVMGNVAKSKCDQSNQHIRHRRGPALARVGGDNSRRSSQRRIAVSSDKSQPLVAEIAVFADYEMWRRYLDQYHDENTAEKKLTDFVTTAYSNIQILYNHPSMNQRIKLKIVKFEIYKYQPYELSGDKHQDGDAQMYLDAFCMYQYRTRERIWDQTFMFTGYDIHRNGGTDKSISGLSRLGGCCDPYNSCVLVEGHDFTSVFVGSHELGHGFGMKHDDDTCNSHYLMSGLLGPGKTSWSTCSTNEMQRFMDDLDDTGSNCLRASTGLSEVLPLDMWHTPGQKYDGDQQCTLMYGVGYRQFLPKDDFSDGPCSMSWCGKANFSRVLTSHPALEGTYCGEYRYCQKGHCSSWSNNPPADQPRAINGQWSQWSRFTCSPCNCAPFKGGLAIVPQTRTCTEPKTENGGTDCPGVGVRGLVCQSQCPATGDTVKSYIRQKCEAARVGVAVADPLTGDGVQLLRSPDRACKIFCALRTAAWYRFYGDLLPDGTPCGKDKYCVAGMCLKLQCDNTTLVSESSMCPSSNERCGTATISESPTIGPTITLMMKRKARDKSAVDDISRRSMDRQFP